MDRAEALEHMAVYLARAYGHLFGRQPIDDLVVSESERFRKEATALVERAEAFGWRPPFDANVGPLMPRREALDRLAALMAGKSGLIADGRRGAALRTMHEEVIHEAHLYRRRTRRFVRRMEVLGWRHE